MYWCEQITIVTLLWTD